MVVLASTGSSSQFLKNSGLSNIEGLLCWASAWHTQPDGRPMLVLPCASWRHSPIFPAKWLSQPTYSEHANTPTQSWPVSAGQYPFCRRRPAYFRRGLIRSSYFQGVRHPFGG